MKGRTVTVVAALTLLVGLTVGIVLASLRSPEPTTVPSIELEVESTSDGQAPGDDKGRHANKGRGGGAEGAQGESTSDGPGSGSPGGAVGSGGSGGGSGGAEPAPPPPPEPAGDDDDDDNGGDNGGDDDD